MMILIKKQYSKYFFVAYVVIVLLLHVVHLGSMGSINKIDVLEIRLDYLLHALAFMPWGVLVWLGFGVNFKQFPKKAALWILAGVIFAAGAEYIQYYLPYRAFNINDVIGNITGILLGSILFFWKSPAQKVKKPGT